MLNEIQKHDDEYEDDEYEAAMRGLAGYKSAADLINAFTRRRMDEDGFYRRIMLPTAFSANNSSGLGNGPIKIIDK